MARLGVARSAEGGSQHNTKKFQALHRAFVPTASTTTTFDSIGDARSIDSKLPIVSNFVGSKNNECMSDCIFVTQIFRMRTYTVKHADEQFSAHANSIKESQQADHITSAE